MLRDILPIAAILFGFQVLVLRRPIKNPARVAMGMVLVLLGLTLFLEGLEMALFPIGRLMAQQLTAPEFIYGSVTLASEVGSLAGFYVGLCVCRSHWVFDCHCGTRAVGGCDQGEPGFRGGTISVNGLRYAVAIGVAVGVALGVFRIITGTPLHWYIISGYVVVIIQTIFAPRFIIPLAYDSGGVTTSTVTVPLVAALGLGLAETIPGRSPILDGFGLIAFTSLVPDHSGYGICTTGRMESPAPEAPV